MPKSILAVENDSRTTLVVFVVVDCMPVKVMHILEYAVDEGFDLGRLEGLYESFADCLAFY